MGYDYKIERPWLFTEPGQVKFLEVRDAANNLFKMAGAVRIDKILGCRSSWQSIACVDRLVELGEFIELTTPNVWCQYRVITKNENK